MCLRTLHACFKCGEILPQAQKHRKRCSWLAKLFPPGWTCGGVQTEIVYYKTKTSPPFAFPADSADCSMGPGCAYCTPWPRSWFSDGELRAIAEGLLSGVSEERDLMREFAQTPDADVVGDTGRLWLECEGWVAERRYGLQGEVERWMEEVEAAGSGEYEMLSHGTEQTWGGEASHLAASGDLVDLGAAGDDSCNASRRVSVLSFDGDGSAKLSRDATVEALNDTLNAFSLEELPVDNCLAEAPNPAMGVVDGASMTNMYRRPVYGSG